MEADFWHQRWERGEIGFHEGRANHFLVKHVEKLNLDKGARIFLPLCGKTRDISWLLSQGYRVVGIELSALAINELFSELGVQPEIVNTGDLAHYRAENIDIFVGDLFKLTTQMLGAVNAIYDRAALVALPEDVRPTYTSHLVGLTDTAPQLLISFEYDQAVMPGPPFSVIGDEIQQLYADTYHVNSIENKKVEGNLKGVVEAEEFVWLLQPTSD